MLHRELTEIRGYGYVGWEGERIVSSASSLMNGRDVYERCKQNMLYCSDTLQKNPPHVTTIS